MPATDVSLIHVPYPEATARELRITVDACHIHLRPGAGAEWVSGTYQDPFGQRSPTLTQDGGTLTIDHDRTTKEPMAELVAGDPVFDLRLGTGQPYALTIQAAAIQSDAELGGLPLTRLAIRQKAGRNHLTFGQANPQSVELLQPSAEAATVEAGNLANANAAAISLKGDAASYRWTSAAPCSAAPGWRSRPVPRRWRSPCRPPPQPGSPQHRCCPTSTSATASAGRRVPTGPQPRPPLIGRSWPSTPRSRFGQLKLRLSQGRS
jgi:hypothetical protein